MRRGLILPNGERRFVGLGPATAIRLASHSAASVSILSLSMIGSALGWIERLHDGIDRVGSACFSQQAHASRDLLLYRLLSGTEPLSIHPSVTAAN